MSQGGGRGSGKGRRTGCGRGRGRGMMPSSDAASLPQTVKKDVFSPATPYVPASPSSNDQEVKSLKAQAQATEQELKAVNEKASQMQMGGRRGSRIASVDAAICTGCGACAAVCAMGAIAVNVVASIETSRCVGCGLCVDECPQKAITLKKL